MKNKKEIAIAKKIIGKPKTRKQLIRENLQWRVAFGVAIFFAALLFGSNLNLKDSLELRTDFLMVEKQNNNYLSIKLKIAENNNTILSNQLKILDSKFETLKDAYKLSIEENRKITQWEVDIAEDYFIMRGEKQQALFELALCREGVSNWEEYAEAHYGIGYIEATR